MAATSRLTSLKTYRPGFSMQVTPLLRRTIRVRKMSGVGQSGVVGHPDGSQRRGRSAPVRSARQVDSAASPGLPPAIRSARAAASVGRCSRRGRGHRARIRAAAAGPTAPARRARSRSNSRRTIRRTSPARAGSATSPEPETKSHRGRTTSTSRCTYSSLRPDRVADSERRRVRAALPITVRNSHVRFDVALHRGDGVVDWSEPPLASARTPASDAASTVL